MAEYTSQYPPEQSDIYVKATTKYNTNFWQYFATDPTTSLTGVQTLNEWLSEDAVPINHRFHIDLGGAKIIKRIYYENGHHSGGFTEYGAQNFTFWGSNSAGSFAELTYGTDTGWTELTVAQNTFDKHIALDQVDPKFIVVTNLTAYRYYAFKISSNYGYEDIVGFRRIELQTEDAPPLTPWLSGWDKRIELDINYDVGIAGEVTWFPITIHLKDANGDSTKVFEEVGANSRQIAITKADGETELKGEIEQWEYDSGTPANSVAIIHTSADGWTINANTSIFLYYHSGHADNDNIDVINTAAAEAVWDGNFKAVYHMTNGVDNAHIYDSTSNDNDATKTGANEPNEVAGKVGQAQDFDGNDDYILSDNNIGISGSSNRTIEVILKTDETVTGRFISEWGSLDTGRRFFFRVRNGGTTIRVGTNGASRTWNAEVTDNAYHYLALILDGTLTSDLSLYLDTSLCGVDATDDDPAINTLDSQITIGANASLGTLWEDIIDEFRISNTNRSVAWIEGTYNSLWDTLLTYGSEETEVAGETHQLISVATITTALTGRITRIIDLISTSVITTSLTALLSRGIKGVLASTSNIVTALTGRITRVVLLVSTSDMVTSLTGSLARGITQALISTSNIVSSITSSLSRGVTEALTSTANIVVSITSSLSRGIVQALTSTANIVVSIVAELTKILGETIALISTAVITVVTTGVLSRGIKAVLASTSSITTSITSSLSRGITQALVSTSNIVTSITASLSRGITQALTSTANIVASITGRITRIINLISTSAITTSVTSVLSRGITQVLISTSAIATSITSVLSRGVTQALTSTSAIVISITSSLSRGITQALTSTVNIVVSITSSLSRGITQALTSTSNIAVSITSVLSRGIKEALTSTSNIVVSITAELTAVGLVLLNSTVVITTSITSTLSRGITEALTSTSTIATSITASLSRGIKGVLTSTVSIATSITSVLSRGIVQALNSTVNIAVSLTGRITKIVNLISTATITTSIVSILRLYSKYTEPEKVTPTYTEPSKATPTLTEPSKSDVTYTEPQYEFSQAEATIKDLNEATIKELNDLTMKAINEKYGKIILTKHAKPTYTETSKGDVSYTEPSKGS